MKNYEIHVKQLGYGPALLVKSSVSTRRGRGRRGNCYSHFQHRICGGEVGRRRLVAGSGSAGYPCLVSKNYPYHAAANPLYEARTVTLTFTAYEDSLLQETLTLTQKKKASESSDVEVEVM